MPYKLVVVFGGKTVERKEVEAERFVIGRSQECDLVIDNLGVSRQHAEIVMEGGVPILKDFVCLPHAHAVFMESTYGDRNHRPLKETVAEFEAIVKRAVERKGNIPFGAGSRMCLGAPFATLIVKLVLSIVLQRFRLQVEPGACIERHGTLTLGAKFGVPVRLHDQDEQFRSSPVTGSIHEMVELPEIGKPAVRAA